MLVHADLHDDNQVWADGKLQIVVDFETVSAAGRQGVTGWWPATHS